MNTQFDALGVYWKSGLESSLLGWMTGVYPERIKRDLLRTRSEIPLWQAGQLRPLDITEVASLHDRPTTDHDRFKQSVQRWDSSKDEWDNRIYKNNALHITIIAPESIIWSLTDIELADFHLEFDVNHIAGPVLNSNGLIFRLTDEDNFYYFAISSDGYYALFKVVENEWSYLVDWTRTDAIKTREGKRSRLGGHSGER